MYKIPLFLLLIICFIACQPKSSTEASEDTAEDTAEVPSLITMQKGGITLTEVSSLPFPEAKLEIVKPVDGSALTGKTVNFEYKVSGYELGTQTGDAGVKLCANSAKGQHIHLILNNAPYIAQYAPTFTQELEPGNYVALSFLSRSYHESVKATDAVKLIEFSVGKAGPKEPFDRLAPHLFYSRPKGEYVGDDVKRVLLDFYLINADLSPDGMKVRAVINDTEFLLDKWVPYAMEGLPMGENSITLTLLDKDGKTVPSPYNPVSRKITLEPAEQ